MSIKKALRLLIFSALLVTPLACFIAEPNPQLVDIPSLNRKDIRTLPRELVAWWKFNDIEGSTAFDSSGHNNHGTVYGARWMDNSLFFNGRDDCVKVPDYPTLKPSLITVETWVNLKTLSQVVLLEKVPRGAYPAQTGWQIWLDHENRNNISAWIGNGDKGKTGLTGATVIRPGRWYHIAMTYDGARLNLYVNGALDASEPNTSGIGDNSAASLTIGYSEYWNYNYLNGLMRDAKIYNYARNASEIQADYNRDRTNDSSIESAQRNDGPIAWWKLDDIEGSTAFDSSGHNNHGTVYGATWSGNALSFDGKNDYVRVPNAPALNPTESFSIDAWIFPTTDNYGHILTKWGDTADWAGQRAYALSTCSGRRLVFGISDDAHQQDGPFHSFLTPEGVLTINAWNHITAVYDKSTGTRMIYVNGTKVAQRTDRPINLTQSRADVTIGAHLASSTMFKPTFFPGLISRVKIYDYARSPEQIRADYFNAPDFGITIKKHQPMASKGPWTLLNPNNSPSARFGAAMNYDSDRQRTVIFGGTFTGKDSIKDTWEWDGINWSRKRPVHSPSTRGFSAMAYDPVRKKTVLFGGGYYGSIYFNDTWEWNGKDWRLIYLANKPSPRVWPIMVYDSARQKMVLFGGFHEGSYLNDTWEWDGINWTQKHPDTIPPGRYYHTMAYDSERRQTVVFGGYTALGVLDNQTWEWDGINWSLKSPVNKPSPRVAPAMAYDPIRSKTVLFGGDSMDDTWEWDGINWIAIATKISPSKRNQHKMVYDSNRRKIILFGGATIQGDSSNETWEYTNISQLKVK